MEVVAEGLELGCRGGGLEVGGDEFEQFEVC